MGKDQCKHNAPSGSNDTKDDDEEEEDEETKGKEELGFCN